MKTIAIVHTVKLDRKGKPRQNYLHRLNAAIELTKHHKIDEIILFGGKTRKKFPSEAKVGQNYLKGKVKVPTTLETVSKATIDSVLNIKKLIKIDKVNKIYVITSDYSLERFKFLYSELYPEAKGKLEFISTKDESGLRFKYAEKFYLAYSKLVPEGGIIAKILQAIFRNGDLDEVKIEKLAKSKSKKSSSRKRDRFLLPFRKGNRRKTFIISSVTLLLFILIFGSFSFFYIKSFDKDLPPPDRLSTRNSKLSTTIYDRNGKELYKFFKDENRELVKLDDLPEYTKLSFLAAEDAEFYNHKGLDYPGIARCFVLTVTNKLSAGHLGNFCGASTITQQLIRNTLMYDVFGNDAYERSSLFPSIRRKLMEMTLALKVDQTYSKDEILQMYLNEVYLGGQTYGIQAASKEYFNKDAKDLSLSESAFLAGILQGPTIYNPVSGTNPELGINRQQYVLGQIEKHFQNDNELTFENIENAKEEELKFVFDPGEIYAPHFVFYVQDYLNKKFAEEGKDENYFQSGLKITTSLDLDLQDKIQAEVTKSITDYKEKYNVNNAAVVAIDPNTFEIIAMLGSANYNEESLEGAGKVNSALSYRQPASTVKPYTYLTAVRQGYGMNFPAPDIEELGKNYGTVNADFLYEGPMTARRALVRSRNIPALYTFELVGQDNFLDTTTKLGIESFNERKHLGELLTLGVGETTLLENTAAYSVFAAEGQKAPVNPILKIEDSNGEVIYESRDVKKEQAFPKEDIYMINWTLCGLGGHEDRFREQAPDYIYQVDGKNALCAKTGTSDGPRDLYTMMYHKNLAVGVWIGNNNNTFMPGGWSFNTALPLARSIMDVTKDKYKPELFAKPENIKETIVCTETGMIPTPADQPCPSEKAIFIEGHAPMQDGRHIIYVCKANRLLPSTLPLEHQPLVDAGYIEGKIAVNAFLDLPKYQPLYEQALKRYYPKYTTKIPGIGECNIPADQLEGGGNTTTLPTEIDTSIRMYSPLFDLDSLRLPRSELSNTNMNIEINAPREVTEIRFYVEKAGETNDTLVETGPLLERDPGTNKTRYNFNFGVFDSYPAGDYNLFIDLFGSGEASIEVHMLPFSIL